MPNKQKKPLAADIVMNELLWYGGEQKTRKAIFDELIAEGFERKYVDYYVFCLANHQPEEAAAEPQVQQLSMF
jgi:hypothetical protein